MSAPQRLVTLSTENQFTFTCPVFNAETKMAACMVLRDAVWKGQHVEKRKGCQACMRGGKCPAAVIISVMGKEAGTSKAPVVDAYGSLEPVHGKLGANILERLLHVVVPDKLLDRMGVPSNERLLIQSADERIAKQLGSAPAVAKGRAVSRGKPPAAPKPEPTVSSTLSDAASTGDMSAAINQGLQQ